MNSFIKKVFWKLDSYGWTKLLGDELFLKIVYKIRLDKKLNLKAPKTFNEKLQWLKLHDRNPLYTDLADKYNVKPIISELIGKEHIIETLAVYDSFDSINFDELPNQFVLKCTHDSGGLVICRDKNRLDYEKAKLKLDQCMKRNYFYHGREWPYKNIVPRIIAEKYMEDNSDKSLKDYKFYCFNNKPELLYISQGLENHKTAHISFFDLNGNRMPFKRTDFQGFDEDPKMPCDMNAMIDLAGKIAEYVNCPFLRVDLYEINGQIYFSKVTFHPCSGFMPFEPYEWDLRLGKMIKLPTDY